MKLSKELKQLFRSILFCYDLKKAPHDLVKMCHIQETIPCFHIDYFP